MFDNHASSDLRPTTSFNLRRSSSTGSLFWRLWAHVFGSGAVDDVSRLTGLTIVCLSDTHGQHRRLTMPPGDILIHAGDYTMHGNRDDAVDFNAWLGELDYRHILVVQGNHETNAAWKGEAADILNNAILLRNDVVEIMDGVRVYGAEFYWPCPSGNPYYAQMDDGIDIVVAHGPAHGYADRGSSRRGCPSLLAHVTRIQPALVVSGHIHEARGCAHGHWWTLPHTVFVNAANAEQGGHSVVHEPAVLQF